MDAMTSDPDWAIRMAAFAALERLVLTHDGRLPWRDIARGFSFEGETVCFASKALGIFKPKQMSAALSVKTTKPRAGRQSRYRDQAFSASTRRPRSVSTAGRQSRYQDQALVIDDKTGLLSYDLAHQSEASNRHLQLAFERKAPIIYFRAVREAVYEAIWPVWVEQFSGEKRRVLLAASDATYRNVSSVRAALAGVPESREPSYYLVETKHRNHQAWFSSRTKSAYGYRCAFSGLPLRDLLVGAHIVPDSEGGVASVPNGICMSALHHTAFDAHLIGVDPDLRIHVGQSVLASRDGPLLASLRDLDSRNIRVPSEASLQPKREYLERRFDQFLGAQA